MGYTLSQSTRRYWDLCGCYTPSPAKIIGKIQAVKLREAIVEANTPKQNTDQKLTEKDILNAIRANREKV